MALARPGIPYKISRLIDKTENHIVSLIEDCENPIKEAGKSIVKAGGKRLRPLMLLLAASPTKDKTTLISAAASVELLHIGSLVHDDLIDNSTLRRGVPVIHESYNDRVAICAGDNLFAQAFFSLAKCQNLDAVKILCRTVGDMSEGQLKELAFKENGIEGADEYIDMIYGKTAALFEASLGIGSLISDNNASKADDLMGYGKALGLAFQLVDDLLDITGDSVVVGKPVGNDLRENTITLPIMLAFKEGLDKNVTNTINAGSTQEEVDKVIAMIKETGAIEEVKDMINKYTEQAKEHAQHADCEMTGKLIEIADYLPKRIK